MDHEPALWLSRIRGIDVVVNAVGILTLYVQGPAALFRACAIEGGSRVVQLIQPVHIDDLASLVVRLVEQPELAPCSRIAASGGQALSFRDYLAVLRRSLGAGCARFLAVPAALVNRLADPALMAACLGRSPRSPEEFLEATHADLSQNGCIPGLAAAFSSFRRELVALCVLCLKRPHRAD
ncbi:hypothetical protein [Aquabacterium sp.]|uniref:hypothetical protein n=1 Tax=Aquabacterium sp. TaxID=1872578 RepID=UPI00248865F4|nr:hypothetical protein [Aquabacterium sp.]MDI1261529.1 hypothetical protein [Aquabacterium sp.]